MKRCQFISRKICISKTKYEMFVKTYGLKLASIVLDVFELEKLFKLPEDLYVAVIDDELYEDFYYQTVTIVYTIKGKCYEHYFYSYN